MVDAVDRCGAVLDGGEGPKEIEAVVQVRDARTRHTRTHVVHHDGVVVEIVPASPLVDEVAVGVPVLLLQGRTQDQGILLVRKDKLGMRGECPNHVRQNSDRPGPEVAKEVLRVDFRLVTMDLHRQAGHGYSRQAEVEDRFPIVDENLKIAGGRNQFCTVEYSLLWLDVPLRGASDSRCCRAASGELGDYPGSGIASRGVAKRRHVPVQLAQR